MSVVVFGYNFPHRKTQDFLLHLFLNGVRVDRILAADWVDLGIPKSTIRTRVRRGALVHPSLIADKIGAEYSVMRHDSSETVECLNTFRPEVGVIAGARILPADVIGAFQSGIINFHPGLIPQCRGLDTLLWSIRKDQPLAVTAHLIDHRVDAGAVIEWSEIPIFHDDTVFDLQERLYDTQLEMLPRVVADILAGRVTLHDVPPSDPAEYNRKMAPDLEADTLQLVPDYLRRRSGGGAS